MGVPKDLAGEYRLGESLNDTNTVMRVESVATKGQYVLKLLDPNSLANDTFPEELQRRSQTEGNRLNTPVRTGSIADGRYFTVTDYRPEGSLYSCLTNCTPLPREAIRPLINRRLLERHLRRGPGRRAHLAARGLLLARHARALILLER